MRTPVGARRRAVGWGVLVGWAVALTMVLCWPMTRSGYLLGHDMVFTPHQPLDLASLGVSSASPRAVPLDALVALSEHVIGGASVARLAVAAPLVALGVGAAVLLPSRSTVARLTTCTAAIWSPFVVERLAVGQWALLWAYAALPWLVLAVRRQPGRVTWAARATALAAASITPTGGLIAAVCAVVGCAALRRPRREVAATSALAVLLQLPWVLPALLSSASATSDPAAVRVFSARAEHGGGVLLSLLGGGGIWDADVVPTSRGGVLAWLALLVIAAAAVYGSRRLATLLGARMLTALEALAVTGLLLAVLPSVPGGAALSRAAVAHLPGAGLLRDAQKWIIPLMLLEALLVGAAVDRLVFRNRTARVASWRALVAVAVLLVPILTLPDAAATVRPTLDPVHYPRDWAAVSRLTREGTATVLPFASYRTFPWAAGRNVLDPAPRLLPVPTVVDDRLAVSGRLLQGEDPRARAVAGALAAGRMLARRLAAAGITWVVVEHATPGTLPALTGLHRVFDGRDVSLYRVPDPVTGYRRSPVVVAAVLGGDVAVLLVLAGLLGAGGLEMLRRSRARFQQLPPGVALL